LTIQFLDIPTSLPSAPDSTPTMTYDPDWLAITRALHPYLSLNLRPSPLPHPDQVDQMVQDEKERLRTEGLLVPALQGSEVDGPPELVWEKGSVEVGRVQKFWPTAPAQGLPGGSESEFGRCEFEIKCIGADL
jgi:lariat debranching enzyme